MTTEILSKLHLTSWDAASAWATNRRFPCELCTEYRAAGKCKLYQLCKANGAMLGAVFFTRKAKAQPEKGKPYRPDPTRGSVRG